MSPGARTIPAAIVLPMAAEMPNHMPRTLSSRPRLGDALAVISVDTSVRESVEGASDGLDNGKTQGVFRNFAMIMCGRENARRNLRRETHAIGNSYRGLVRGADKIPLAPCERFMRGSEIQALEMLESKLMESVQSVATAATQLDNFRVARPLVGAQFHQTPDKFANLLFRAFKPQVGNFPRIGRSHAALLKFGIDAHRDSVPYERAFFEAPRNGVACRPGIVAHCQKSRPVVFPHVAKITCKTLSWRRT